MELKLPLLLYDAECPLCVRFKQGLERLDVGKRVTYHPLQDESVFTQFPQLDPAVCRTEVHYVREDGTVLKGGEVVTELLRHFPGVDKMAWLLDTDVGKKTAEFFYRTVEEARARLTKKDDDCDKCPRG